MSTRGVTPPKRSRQIVEADRRGLRALSSSPSFRKRTFSICGRGGYARGALV